MDEHELQGGSGGDCAPDVRETRLHERAIRERWPIPEHVRVKILNRLLKIVDEDAFHADQPRPSHREVTSAIRALISADKANLEHLKLEMKANPAQDRDARHALLDDCRRKIEGH